MEHRWKAKISVALPDLCRVTLAAACLLLPIPASADEAAKEIVVDTRDAWPQWRGPLATGVAPFGDPPVTWSDTENVRWKIRLPGLGHSTPVIWDDRIFLTTAVAHGEALPAPDEHDHGAHHNLPASKRQKFLVLAIDRTTGQDPVANDRARRAAARGHP